MSLAEQRITPQQYLELERAAEYKSEYLNGEMFAMTGATRKHNLIVTNLISQLHAHFASRSCEANQKTRVSRCFGRRCATSS